MNDTLWRHPRLRSMEDLQPAPASDRVMINRPSSDAERLNELKREIAIDAYEVDASEIADAILRKLRLVKSVRLALAGIEADRIPRPSREDPPIP